MLDRSRDAPTTATDLGDRKVRMALTEAEVSRRSNCWTASSVSETGNSTSISPGRARIDRGNPLSRKTPIIPWFSGRTSATKMVTPRSAAAWASWPSRIEPMPLPCHSSATDIPISARPPSIREYWAPPIIVPSSPPRRTSSVR